MTDALMVINVTMKTCLQVSGMSFSWHDFVFFRPVSYFSFRFQLDGGGQQKLATEVLSTHFFFLSLQATRQCHTVHPKQRSGGMIS